MYFNEMFVARTADEMVVERMIELRGDVRYLVENWEEDDIRSERVRWQGEKEYDVR
jgi:hypothetical protein